MKKSLAAVTMAMLLGMLLGLASPVLAISNTNQNSNIAQTQRVPRPKCFTLKNQSIIATQTLTRQQYLFLQTAGFTEPLYENYVINRSVENIMQSCLKGKAPGSDIFGFSKKQVGENEFEYTARFTRIVLVRGKGQPPIIGALVIVTVKYPGNGANPVISSRQTA